MGVTSKFHTWMGQYHPRWASPTKSIFEEEALMWKGQSGPCYITNLMRKEPVFTAWFFSKKEKNNNLVTFHACQFWLTYLIQESLAERKQPTNILNSEASPRGTGNTCYVSWTICQLPVAGWVAQSKSSGASLTLSLWIRAQAMWGEGPDRLSIKIFQFICS